MFRGLTLKSALYQYFMKALMALGHGVHWRVLVNILLSFLGPMKIYKWRTLRGGLFLSETTQVVLYVPL